MDTTEFDFPGSNVSPPTTPPQASPCCSSEKQSTCCEATEKSSCCGSEATADGGCGCQ